MRWLIAWPTASAPISESYLCEKWRHAENLHRSEWSCKRLSYRRYSLEYVADEDVAQEEYLVGRLRALGLVRAATEN